MNSTTLAALNTTTMDHINTSATTIPLPDSPTLSARRKNPNTLSWSSTSSSFSTNSSSSLSSTSTPTTAVTTSTLPLMMMRSTSRTLPLLMSDDDDDMDELDDVDDLHHNGGLLGTATTSLEQEQHYNLHQRIPDNNNNDDDQALQQQLHQQRWHRRVTKSLAYAASHGDSLLVQRILTDERLRPFLNVDGSDDKQMGTTPLIYASCFGYASIVRLLLDAGASVDGQDKMGWSPLMWATTNNHKVIVELLISHGASWANRTTKGRTVLDFVDYDDQELVHILTPEPTTTNANEHTLPFDEEQQHHYKDFFQQISLHKRRQRSSTIPKLDLDEDTFFSYEPLTTDGDTYGQQQQQQQEDLESKRQKSLVESLYTKDDDELDELVSCEASMESLHHFVWNRCLPDQMFVFAEEDIPHILSVTVSSLKLPMKTRHEIWVPSNVLFLCARFAHYYSGRELLAGILGQAISMIASVLHKNKGDIHTTAFWMANLSQLLYYLKKDTGLVVATAEQQLEISELVSETYVLLVTDSEKRIEKILEASMLDHDLIGADPVDFADDWQRFFRRRGSSRRPSSMASVATTATSSTMEQTQSMSQRAQEIHQDDSSSIQQHSIDLTGQAPTSPMNSLSSFMSSTSVASPSFTTLSPHSITSLLSSILYVLQSYEVHPAIIMQAIAQFFHFMSCEIFNRILTNKKFMCRSKALQIRMNLSIIEDWVREQHPYLPLHLTSYFDPLIQLVQLLQCVSQLNELSTFVGTTTGFELLNPLQIRRCLLNYRYEVDEPRLPDEIEKYTIQLAQSAINNTHGGRISQQKKRPLGGDHSMEMSSPRCSSTKIRTQPSPLHSNPVSRRHSQVSSRPTSVSSLGSLIMSRWTSNSVDDRKQQQPELSDENESSKRWTEQPIDGDDDDNDNGDDDYEDDTNDTQGRDWIEEKRDSKYMLPFSLPTSTTMVHYASYHQQQHYQPLRLELDHRQEEEDDDDDEAHRLSRRLHDLVSTESFYEEARQKKGATEREKKAKERTVIPTIPQEWMDRLDRRQDPMASSQEARRAMEMS